MCPSSQMPSASFIMYLALGRAVAMLARLTTHFRSDDPFKKSNFHKKVPVSVFFFRQLFASVGQSDVAQSGLFFFLCKEFLMVFRHFVYSLDVEVDLGGFVVFEPGFSQKE